MKCLAYRCLTKIPFTRPLVNKLEEKIKIVYPDDKLGVMVKVNKQLNRMMVISLFVLGLFVFIGRFELHYAVIGMAVIYASGINYVYSDYYAMEYKLLKQFENFLQDVRFHFKFDGMLVEALTEALQNTEYEMSIHGQKILDSLEDKGDENGKYRDIAPNHFLLTFYALCETCVKYGDKMIDGNSLFLMNVGYLKDDINTEILLRNKNKSLFMGLFGVTIVPLFAIKPIEVWSVSNTAGLREYYYSVMGNVTSIVLAIVTIVIYRIIMKLYYPLDFDNEKSSMIERISENKLVNKYIYGKISSNYRYYYKLQSLLKSVVYKYSLVEFLVMRYFSALTAGVLSLLIVLSTGYVFSVRSFIVSALFSVLMSILVYKLVLLSIYLRKKFLEINREEEVVRFQSIILILMYMDRVTVETIMEWMGNFAIVFKNYIEEMEDSFAYKGFEIFEEIKMKIEYLPFSRLLDCFVASDRLGIEKAFQDVKSDRLYYVEKHKQENEQILMNKALIAKTLAFLPLCLIIIVKLIFPFVQFGLNQIGNMAM